MMKITLIGGVGFQVDFTLVTGGNFLAVGLTLTKIVKITGRRKKDTNILQPGRTEQLSHLITLETIMQDHFMYI